MRSWVKAGLIGGAVLAVLDLLGLIPVVGIVNCCLTPLAYLAIGGLAANWLPLPRQTGQAAGEGALAGGLAAVIGGIVYTLFALIQAAILGSARVLSQIPPDIVQQFRDLGLDPELLNVSAGPVGALAGGSICCVFMIVAGALVGALGGLLWAAMRPNQ